jgi:hypothetical protein
VHRLFGYSYTSKWDPGIIAYVYWTSQRRCIQTRRIVLGDRSKHAIVVKKQIAEPGSAEAYRVRQDALKDTLQLTRRAANYVKHFRARRLLLACFDEFTGATVEFSSHVNSRRTATARSRRDFPDFARVSAGSFHSPDPQPSAATSRIQCAVRVEYARITLSSLMTRRSASQFDPKELHPARI